MELKVTAVARDGAGVARDPSGRVVFVDDALEGETVTVDIHTVEKRWSRGRVIRVIEASPDRVAVSCVHRVEGCGGCDLLHLAPSVHARFKESIVVEQLVRAGLEVDGPSHRPLVNDHGRTSARLAITEAKAGFRLNRSHEVVGIEMCQAVDPMIDEIIRSGRFPHADEVTVRVGHNTGERMVVISGSGAGVIVPDGVAVVTESELEAGKRAWIHEEAAGRRWRISAHSFFQNRPAGAEALVAEVKSMVDEFAPPDSTSMVDAYGGVGLFAGTVLPGAAKLLIELSPSAVADARINLENDDTRVLRLDAERWRPSAADVVVADPARAGLGAKATEALLGADPSLFVLVSCDAASFAADASRLMIAGFDLARWTVVDLFPGTSHVETIGAFVR